MSFHSTYCPVSHDRVPCEHDLEGQTIRVLCAELQAGTNRCGIQTRAHESGWLGEFLERADENTLDTRGSRCRLLDTSSTQPVHR